MALYRQQQPHCLKDVTTIDVDKITDNNTHLLPITTSAPWSIHRLSLATKIIIGFALPIILMVMVSTAVYFSTQNLIDTATWVQHTQKVITKGHLLENLILEMETGERGFLITGKEEFLTPFVDAKEQWSLVIHDTAALVKDNPAQVKNLDNIDNHAKQWLTLAAEPEIKQRRKVQSNSISLDHIQTILQNKTGKKILDEIRIISNDLDNTFVTAQNQQAANLLMSILKDIVDQETGERGFLITGEESFLTPYHQGKRNFKKHISQLRSLILNTPSSKTVSELIEKTQNLAIRWQQEAALPEIEFRRTSDINEKVHNTTLSNSKETGKIILDELRVTLNSLNSLYSISGNESAQILILALAKSIIDQETSQRGFLLTGKEQFLVPFNKGKYLFINHANKLKDIIKNSYDKTETLSQINNLEDKLNDWNKLAAQVEINTRRTINSSGLSQMEFLQRTLASGIDNPAIIKSQAITREIETAFTKSKNSSAINSLLKFKYELSKVKLNFTRFMINGEDTPYNNYNNAKELLFNSLVKITILANTKKKTPTTKHLIENTKILKSSVFDWFQNSLEPAIHTRRNISQSRSTAAVQIQNILKNGVGKNIIEKTQTLIHEIIVDFTKAKNFKAVNLALQIEKNLVDQETGERGFIITGDESFLEPYTTGNTNLNIAISRLINIASQAFDINETMLIIKAIESNILKWKTISADPEIALRRKVDSEQGVSKDIEKALIIGLGKSILDDIREQQNGLNSIFLAAKNKTAQRIVLAISKDIVDMETGQRGFLLTGKDTFLKPLTSGLESVYKHTSELKKLVNSGYDSKTMINKINTIRDNADQWRELAGQPEITLRRKLSNTGASMIDVTRLIDQGTGKKLIESIRKEITNFINIEEKLIIFRAEQSESASRASILQTIFGTLFSTIIAFIAAIYLLKTILNSLKNIADATKQVAQGDYSVEINVQSNDQIGKLAGAFNTMTTQLETSRTAMNEARIDLEENALALQDKTNEIEEQNSSLQATKEKLQEYTRELELSSQYKSDFLATMSHEIRTPMNGVLGMLALLLKTNLSEDQKKKANMARTSAKSLLSIINDILDFSKIDAGKMELEILDFDLRSLLGDLAETMAIKAQEKGLEIILDVIHIEDSMVKGDPSRILQVLTNLLGNSIKFTHKGEIIIRAHLKNTDDNNQILTCSIQDTGIGIPQDQQANMFKAFHQVDASTTRKYGGTGLGLSIVKQLCELMGGDINVSSPEGGGSRFEFTVMLKCSEKSKHVLPKLNLKALSLLVVDPNESSRNTLCQQLVHWGCKVHSSHDASTSLELINDLDSKGILPIDLVFINAELPDMDGLQLAKAIRANKNSQDIKLVLMTSMSNSGNRQHFYQQGFSANFPKPATTSDIFDALAVLLEDAQVIKELSPHIEASYENFISQDNIVDIQPKDTAVQSWPDNTRLLLVEDNFINQEVAKHLLEDLSLPVDVASDGKEALEMLNNSPTEHPYSLVLMDCQMPVMDGFTTTQNIRLGLAGDRFKAAPIIALTANAMQGDREKCLAEGMNDYLSKPIDSDLLEAMLYKWLVAKHIEISSGDGD